jgi:hypothetical protein
MVGVVRLARVIRLTNSPETETSTGSCCGNHSTDQYRIGENLEPEGHEQKPAGGARLCVASDYFDPLIKRKSFT